MNAMEYRRRMTEVLSESADEVTALGDDAARIALGRVNEAALEAAHDQAVSMTLPDADGLAALVGRASEVLSDHWGAKDGDPAHAIALLFQGETRLAEIRAADRRRDETYGGREEG